MAGPPRNPEAAGLDPAGIGGTPVPPGLAAVRRTILSVSCVVLAAALVVAAVLSGWTWLWIALLVPVLGAAFGWNTIGRQVRAWGYADRADDLLIKRGLM